MIDQETLVRTLVAERVKVLAYIHSLIRRRDAAEDVFQHICAAAVQNRNQIESEAHLLNWMRLAAKREVMNLVRKRREINISLDADIIDLMSPVWREADATDYSHRAEALRVCLSRLSKPHQDLIQKRFVENYGYERLAGETDRSVNSLYVTFSRIYTTLGKCISARLESETRSRLA